MKKFKLLYLSFLVILFWGYNLYSQTTEYSYQMILETQQWYNHLKKNSNVNPDNFMGISELSSLSKFYPVLSFKNNLNNIETSVHIEGNIENYDLVTDSTYFSFQELYGQISLKDKHYFTVGKKRLSWGTGLVWNPTNFFIQKDPLRTQNRLEGIFMLNYSYIFLIGSLNIYIFPEDKIENFKTAIKFDYSGNQVDASASFLEYKEYQQFGFDLNYAGGYLTAYLETVLKNYTNSYIVNKDGTLIEPEQQKKEFRPEIVAGTSILFNSQITLYLEYRYRGDFLNKVDIDNYKNYLPENSVIYDPISIGKHTTFSSIEYKENYGRWSVSIRNFYDPLSNQLILSPQGILTVNNFQVELSSMIYSGSLSTMDYALNILLSYSF